MRKKTRILFGSGGPYIVFALCLLAAGVLGYQFFVPSAGGDEAEPQTTLQAEQPKLPAARDEAEAPAAVTAPEENSDRDAAEPQPPEVPVVAQAPDVPAEKPAPQLHAPLEGKTIAAFSAEVLAYNEALNDWRTHNGVDIAAEEGTPVCAACDGTVLSVTEDPLMGVTVVLEHDDDFTTTYACLGTEVYVSAGDSVQAGQSIGAVGATAAGESAEPHLHFSITRDGKLIDPAEYLR